MLLPLSKDDLARVLPPFSRQRHFVMLILIAIALGVAANVVFGKGVLTFYAAHALCIPASVETSVPGIEGPTGYRAQIIERTERGCKIAVTEDYSATAPVFLGHGGPKFRHETCYKISLHPRLNTWQQKISFDDCPPDVNRLPLPPIDAGEEPDEGAEPLTSGSETIPLPPVSEWTEFRGPVGTLILKYPPFLSRTTTDDGAIFAARTGAEEMRVYRLEGRLEGKQYLAMSEGAGENGVYQFSSEKNAWVYLGFNGGEDPTLSEYTVREYRDYAPEALERDGVVPKRVETESGRVAWVGMSNKGHSTQGTDVWQVAFIESPDKTFTIKIYMKQCRGYFNSCRTPELDGEYYTRPISLSHTILSVIDSIVFASELRAEEARESCEGNRVAPDSSAPSIGWPSLIHEACLVIRNALVSQGEGLNVSILPPVRILKEVDLTGDWEPEAMIFTGETGASNMQVALMTIKEDGPAFLRYGENKRVMLLRDGGGVAHGSHVVLLAEKNAVAVESYSLNTLTGEQKHCGVEAYIWKPETEVFEANLALAGELTEAKCH